MVVVLKMRYKIYLELDDSIEFDNVDIENVIKENFPVVEIYIDQLD